jgi:hypothetical protein
LNLLLNVLLKGGGIIMERTNTANISNFPESVFGVTLDDAIDYGKKLEERSTSGFINEPVRDTTNVSFWEFMGSDLPEKDKKEISETMKILAGELS